MTQSAISIESISKCYLIGSSQGETKETLAAQIVSAAHASASSVWRRLRASSHAHEHLHWALRDVTFSIPEGQVVGIIGHNGAGKSTLLKILSRVTRPSSGCARVRGRMASLLEVGTGFHPDLTGRDNVQLNGSILGMSRREIAARFDEIVAFSGVEEYIDTPIKYYSSGMRVRLAFAVAAHLDPDILVIDEVLAVGDAEFQRKCLNRIEQVGQSGRTVLFVSHQLNTVARLCSRAIVLDHGKVACDDGVVEGIRYYSECLGLARASRTWGDREPCPGDDVAQLSSVELTSESKTAAGPIDVTRPVEVHLRYRLMKSDVKLTPSIHLFDATGTWVFSAIDLEQKWHDRPRPSGEYRTTARIPENLLNEGSYTISVALATLQPFMQHCYVQDCLGFTTFDPATGNSARGHYRGPFPGAIRPILQWTTVRG